MKTRPIGKSGIEASVIGLGTWGIGGWMWGGEDEEQSIRSINIALDAGINLIDTAPIYGFGRSEEVVGKAIRDRRDEVVLATKCGMVCNTTKGRDFMRSTSIGVSENGHIHVFIYLDPESIRREVEMSLKRLQTDRIDLLQTHWQEETTPREDTMAALLKLKDEGKIRAIGVSNASVEQMTEYQKAGDLDSDQEKYSMLDREIEQEQLKHTRENDMAMLAYSSLALGALTGKIQPGQDFGPGDLRAESPRFSDENLKKINAMLDEIKPIAEAHDLSLAQLALAWTVHQPGLTHALVGARDPDHARSNAKAGSVELSDQDLRTINEAIEGYDGK